MGRTATFKAGERRIRPTGSDAAADSNTANSLFREVDEKGNPIVTVQSEGAHPLPASAPAEVVTDSRELSELDVKQDAVFDPTDEELANFDALVKSGLSETEAAAEVWPGVDFTTDDEVEDVIEEIEDAGNTEETAPEEETVEETTEEVVPEETKDEESDGDEETAAEEVARKYPEGEPTDKWLVSSIDAWAADQEPVIEFPSGATKPQKLAHIKEATA
ncbi:hypothetical protein HOT31_gp058 [Microbacterium phage Hendrix]|uniref:Uncharacterized protein n=1 Tax=Microbacterium phage Hendrix TaxID=2182341 RepID=A0A2U8UUD3_9CAUD|nr:hypothetical protein HOT31_gp058 [Microbacterium phage Hendrix]AWN07729.1 hypothetical protein PBI_HENDRIX_58 [Microbacterium phage Hendrix]